MTYPTGSKKPGGTDPAVTRGVMVLIVVALVGIVLLAGSGSFTAKNASTKKTTTTTGVGGATTTATTTTAPAAPTTHPPADTKVVVLNATGGLQQNAGSENSTKLGPGGFNVLPALDATNTSPTSMVYFASGYEADAKAVAKLLGIPATSVAATPATTLSNDPSVNNANVIAVIGTDHANSGGTSTGGT